MVRQPHLAAGVLALIAAYPLGAAGAWAADPQPALVELAIGAHRLKAEVANEPATRRNGLMHREWLPQDQGMLFVFASERRHCMWMRDTLIPLSVAFVDASGEILNLARMTPLSEVNHCADAPSRYALEMRQGWFARRGIAPGERLEGLDALPGPR